MLPGYKLKVLLFDLYTGIAHSKTTSKEIPHLNSFDETSRSAYGILFKDDAFVFGITDFLYQKKLTTKAGFLMNTEKYRLTELFDEDY